MAAVRHAARRRPRAVGADRVPHPAALRQGEPVRQSRGRRTGGPLPPRDGGGNRRRRSLAPPRPVGSVPRSRPAIPGMIVRAKPHFILWYVSLGFSLIILLSWLNELLSLPTRLFGGTYSPNWHEAIIETIVVVAV